MPSIFKINYLSPLQLKSISQGSHKVKYQADSDWDFQLVGGQLPIDLSLILPHYRARNQPVDHRMAMFVANDSAPIKLKVVRRPNDFTNFFLITTAYWFLFFLYFFIQQCRSFPSKFYLEVLAETSDVTVWLPSDFKGQIHHSGKATFSPGFINRILRNVRINEPEVQEIFNEDNVVVVTRGHVTFRMWDIRTSSPENTRKELLSRLFCCSRKAPEHETAIDWDFLIKDWFFFISLFFFFFWTQPLTAFFFFLFCISHIHAY